MLKLKNTSLLERLEDIDLNSKLQINTINAHSYNVAQEDAEFAKILLESDILLPDGQSVVWAKRFLTGEKLQRIAGYDLFVWEMQRLNKSNGCCFFLGSTVATLDEITKKISLEYPNVRVVTYSPPYKPIFTEEDNRKIRVLVNDFTPDVLFVGMTAPKQEKWVNQNYQELSVGHICSIGAVFDFYAGNIQRAPFWMQKNGLEWLYRLIKEPRRMWKRYIIGNTIFIYYIVKEKMNE